MTYVFDIDGTICTKVDDGNYLNAKPLQNRIDVVNRLYEEGNRIIFQTARGIGRHNNQADLAFLDFYDLTTTQLSQWKVKYHMLLLGKASGDLYIDDKGIKDEDFFNTRN